MGAQLEMFLDNLEAVLAAADMSLANVVRLNLYTTDFDELVKHWGGLADRFGNSGGRFATTLLGVTRLFTPQLLVLLEATAVIDPRMAVDRGGRRRRSGTRMSARRGAVSAARETSQHALQILTTEPWSLLSARPTA